MDQRFGFDLYKSVIHDGDSPRIWIHAASVGEVQAAKVLIDKLRSRMGEVEYFLTTMTIQGQKVARNQLPSDVICFLAPLDVPVNVRRFLAKVKPDLYICLETELWPAMFIELQRFRVPSLLLNGRMTLRSYDKYCRIRRLMKTMLGTLCGAAVISHDDENRYKDLGVKPEILQVTGNIKYDYPVEDRESIRKAHRKILQAEEEVIFVCGSTRTGEEELLLQVFRKLQKQVSNMVIWVVAPRHLERLAEVERLFTESGLEFDRYSEVKKTGRTHSVVLVDTMGELGQLYSGGDLNFVGGSLFNQRGHNIMEAARWGRPVYYGQCIDDYKDAAEILEKTGGAFRVTNGDALVSLLIAHLQDREKYEKICANAAHAVSLQQGAADRQADMVMNVIAGHGHFAEQTSL